MTPIYLGALLTRLNPARCQEKRPGTAKKAVPEETDKAFNTLANGGAQATTKIITAKGHSTLTKCTLPCALPSWVEPNGDTKQKDAQGWDAPKQAVRAGRAREERQAKKDQCI